MRRPYARLAAASALAVATSVFCGSALAGGGNGNSANAPGQQKAAQNQPVQQSQPAPQSRHSSGSTQQAGVKPSSSTAHTGEHPSHTTVGASPDVSKRYGNGKTAAEIAKSRGAPDSQPLTGPGNSQPHKTYDCSHKNNPSGGVDVHAIKSYSSSSCTTQVHVSHEQPVQKPVQKPEEQPQSQAPEQSHKVTICHATGSATNPYVEITVDEHALQTGHTTAKGDIIPAPAGGCPTAAQAPVQQAPAQQAPAQQAPAQQAPVQQAPAQQTPQVVQQAPVQQAPTAPAQLPTGGVAGATTTLHAPKAHRGVLGTVTHLAGTTLPFTGFPLWVAVLAAIVLILAGLGVYRRGARARL